MKFVGITIGELARRADVGVETVRYYERRGLLKEPVRRESGYRQYEPQAVGRLRFIRRAKELGFTLSEIAELLALSDASTAPCDAVRTRTELKITEVQRKIDDLEQIRRVLARLLESCRKGAPIAECPIIASLNDSR